MAVILGGVEGITEFLPISSTAHLMMAGKFLGLPATEFFKTFEIAIQAGAILAVVWIYFGKLKQDKTVWLKLLSAFLPTAIVGFVLYKLIKEVFLTNFLVPVLALIIGGLVLIIFERWEQAGEREVKDLSYQQAAIIGLAQALAIVPGVSRAAAVIVASRLNGLSRAAAVEFSFLLAVPTIAAAAGYDLLKTGFTFTPNEFWLLIIGLVTSFVFALISIRWLLKYISTHDFKPFGIYRIIIGLLFLALIF